MARKRQAPPLHNAHDHSYKLLFSHPEMVADLLLPSRMSGINFNQVNDLQEVNSMLSERVKSWEKNWMQ